MKSVMSAIRIKMMIFTFLTFFWACNSDVLIPRSKKADQSSKETASPASTPNSDEKKNNDLSLPTDKLEAKEAGFKTDGAYYLERNGKLTDENQRRMGSKGEVGYAYYYKITIRAEGAKYLTTGMGGGDVVQYLFLTEQELLAKYDFANDGLIMIEKDQPDQRFRWSTEHPVYSGWLPDSTERP